MSAPEPDAVGRAYLYLSAVSERPTAPLWDLVDAHGPIAAVEAIRAGDVGAPVADQTSARAAGLEVDELLERADRVGAGFLHPGHAAWPGSALAPLDVPRAAARGEGRTPDRQIALRPFGLWWRGPSPGAWAPRAAALVGTRAPSSYGRVVAAEIAATCAAEGIGVVSGGAFGIDAAAHRAALTAGGHTVAVLAGGVDVLYPRGNTGLLTEIASSGAVLSAQPPGTSVARFRFLDRNRLIAALSGASVVVEAAVRSGALSTAAWARGIGRPVGAVPGPITAVTSLGCHALLRDTDAVLVSRPEDVVELAGRMGDLAPPPEAPTTSWDGLDDISRRVLDHVPPQDGISTDELSVASGVTGSRTRVALGLLQGDGRVERTTHGWRRRADRGTQTVLPLA